MLHQYQPVTIGNANPYVPYSGGDPLSGGTSTTSGLYTIRTFSSSDTLDIYTPTYVQYLCVAGGGAGSRAGEGGWLTRKFSAVPAE